MRAGRPFLGFMRAGNPSPADIEAQGRNGDDPTPHDAIRTARWLINLGGSHARQAEVGRRSDAVTEEKFDLNGISACLVVVLEDPMASA